MTDKTLVLGWSSQPRVRQVAMLSGVRRIVSDVKRNGVYRWELAIARMSSVFWLVL